MKPSWELCVGRKNGRLSTLPVVIWPLLKDTVPGYQPDGEVVNWVWVGNAKAA